MDLAGWPLQLLDLPNVVFVAVGLGTVINKTITSRHYPTTTLIASFLGFEHSIFHSICA
jgi:hypothetical protein